MLVECRFPNLVSWVQVLQGTVCVWLTTRMVADEACALGFRVRV